MPIIVQKFGGSSVADSREDLWQPPAKPSARRKTQGNQVVVVVSAMGDNARTI